MDVWFEPEVAPVLVQLKEKFRVKNTNRYSHPAHAANVSPAHRFDNDPQPNDDLPGSVVIEATHANIPDWKWAPLMPRSAGRVTLAATPVQNAALLTSIQG